MRARRSKPRRWNAKSASWLRHPTAVLWVTKKSATPSTNLLVSTMLRSGRWLGEAKLSPLALTWMEREANRALPWSAGQIGVVIAAHGSDWHWNESMRSALQALQQEYKLEYAFSMADAPVLERAVRRLNERGARKIVIVRVFGMRDSFQAEIERLTGADIEADRGHAQHPAGGGHGAHGAHGVSSAPRIRSAALLTSVGGLDDHPLFAQALLARASALSHNPGRETVILTAHGTHDDACNAEWLGLLESLAANMRAHGGVFRHIRVATWREDWPEKRAPWVQRVRDWVEQDSRDGEVIVIPARTNGTGPEAELLAGLHFQLGSGFAPHPLFATWLREQIDQAWPHTDRLFSSARDEAAAIHPH